MESLIIFLNGGNEMGLHKKCHIGLENLEFFVKKENRKRKRQVLVAERTPREGSGNELHEAIRGKAKDDKSEMDIEIKVLKKLGLWQLKPRFIGPISSELPKIKEDRKKKLRKLAK
ncbi:hypothetical protein RCL_jg26394.t1 [Rhizophagus clarus]|uniref:Uncharacterized protein n=1 Tax=Rhizophagus clarus TaxID=94130 RepID=A0A8H3LI75_9GLOM|nr:hypothetical protein RCL_jg26394.t1 [Rhizophagus clarus]